MKGCEKMHVITKISNEIIIKNKHKRNKYMTVAFMGAIMGVAIYLDLTKDFLK